MSATPLEDPPRIELLIRDGIQPALQEQVDRLCERAHALVEFGAAAGVETAVWGTHIPLEDGVDTGGAERERYRAFGEWAERADVALDPGFSTHRTRTLVNEGGYRVVTVPCVTMALYDGDRLVAVYPHRDGEQVRTVADGIAALSPAFEPLDADRETPGQGERPAHGESLADRDGDSGPPAETTDQPEREPIELEPRGE